MGKASREKGKRGERWLAHQMRLALPECAEHIKRGWQTRGAKGTAEPDVHAPGVWLEMKSGKKPSPRAALAQAEADSCETGLMPVAVIKDDRQEAFIVMRFGDWLELYVEAHRARQA